MQGTGRRCRGRKGRGSVHETTALPEVAAAKPGTAARVTCVLARRTTRLTTDICLNCASRAPRLPSPLAAACFASSFSRSRRSSSCSGSWTKWHRGPYLKGGRVSGARAVRANRERNKCHATPLDPARMHRLESFPAKNQEPRRPEQRSRIAACMLAFPLVDITGARARGGGLGAQRTDTRPGNDTSGTAPSCTWDASGEGAAPELRAQTAAGGCAAPNSARVKPRASTATLTSRGCRLRTVTPRAGAPTCPRRDRKGWRRAELPPSSQLPTC